MSSFPISDLHFNVEFTMDSQCWLRGGPANRGICRAAEALWFAVKTSMKDFCRNSCCELWTCCICHFLDLTFWYGWIPVGSQCKASSTGGLPSFWRTSIFGEGLPFRTFVIWNGNDVPVTSVMRVYSATCPKLQGKDDFWECCQCSKHCQCARTKRFTKFSQTTSAPLVSSGAVQHRHELDRGATSLAWHFTCDAMAFWWALYLLKIGKRSR